MDGYVGSGGNLRDGEMGAVDGAAMGFLEGLDYAPGAGGVVEKGLLEGAVGGVTTEAAGGSFANVAWSAAFQQMFNAALHTMAQSNGRTNKFKNSSLSDKQAQAAFGETSGIYPEVLKPGENPYSSKNWDFGSWASLQIARAYIGAVSLVNPYVNFVAPPSSSGFVIHQAWQQAIRAASISKTLNLPKNVDHFFLRQGGVGVQTPPWSHVRLYQSFGPFINVGGGDVPAGTKTYIDFYQEAPH